MLTLKILKQLQPDEIFATGVTIDGPEGANMMGTGKLLKWVACIGQTHDWAIYCNYYEDNKSLQEIHDNGEKVTMESNIKNLVPCDEGAFSLYRY